MSKHHGYRPRRAWARRGTGVSTLVPNRFGLTRAEMRAELRRCARQGWQTWELRQLVTPQEKRT